MNKTSIGVLALVVGVIIGGMLASAMPKGDTLAGVTIENETFKGAVTVEGLLTGADLTSTDDVTVGDDLTVTEDLFLSDNDFCIEFFATSTATAVKMVASTTVASGSNIGVITMQYGSCDE